MISWEVYYELAKIYFNYYGNLKVLSNFKTSDGIHYDENGINLGGWIINQRRGLKGTVTVVLTEERIEKLNKIGMIWDVYESKWQENYKLVEKYYKHYNNIKIPADFKTSDGIHYDENGVSIGEWVHTQRRLYKLSQLSEEKINLLNKLNMVWNGNEDEWSIYYELAKKYYEYYGHLIIPRSFKTSDGIHYDENGYRLGKWISTQRNGYKCSGNYQINNERIEKLNKIGMVWDVKEYRFINKKITSMNVSEIQVQLLSRVKDFLESLSFKDEIILCKEEVDTINCLFNLSIDSSKRDYSKIKKVSK